jgi:hypothetical protein
MTKRKNHKNKLWVLSVFHYIKIFLTAATEPGSEGELNEGKTISYQ